MNNYEDYCKSFISDETRKRAELICCSRSWLAGMIMHDEDGTEYFGTDTFEFGDFEGGNDPLSHIIDQFFDAFKYISNNLRDKIVRENTLVPLYQAREINSAGMNWISRRPGRTVREKLSGTSSILAVKRRFCFDTGENRLFVELLKDVCELLECKRKYLPEEYFIQKDEDFYENVSSFLRSSPVEEIARWENLPPNNTLLSDRHYVKIWNSWQRLQELDELIKYDNEHIDEHLCTAAFWKFFSIASQYFMFIQTPVRFSYEKFEVKAVSDKLYGKSPDGAEFCIWQNENVLNIINDFKYYEITVTVDRITIKNGYQFQSIDVYSAKDFIEKLENFGNRLTEGLQPLTKFSQIIKMKQVYVDLFNLHPYYCENCNEAERLDKTFACANFNVDGSSYELNLDCTRALNTQIVQEVISPFSCHNNNDYRKLFSVLKNSLKTNDLTFLFPDIYDEFSLSPYRRAARIFYNSVSTLPRSIAAAFYFENSPLFDELTFDDSLLIADLVNGSITLTLVKNKYSNEIEEATNGSRNFVWERYPSMNFSEIISEEITDIKCFAEKAGIKLYDLESETDDFSDRSAKIDLDISVDRFRKNHEKVIGNGKIFVIALDDRMVYEGEIGFVTGSEIVSGCAICHSIMKTLDHSLWRDHLPHLAIKLLFDTFDLVKDQTIVPLRNNEVKIDISNTFTLTAGKKIYRFRLLQEEGRDALMYQAEITNKAFPLSNDVECRLDMRYRYGADEPYALKFIPLNAKNAGFRVADVAWKKQDKYDALNLPVPSYPNLMTWEEMKHIISKKTGNELDALNWMQTSFEYYYNIFYGPYCTIDFNSPYINILKEYEEGVIVYTQYQNEMISLLIDKKIIERYKRSNNQTHIIYLKPEDPSEDVIVNLSKKHWKKGTHGYYCFEDSCVDPKTGNNIGQHRIIPQ